MSRIFAEFIQDGERAHQFPCPVHPQKDLTMVCLRMQCPNKGIICQSCYLLQHRQCSQDVDELETFKSRLEENTMATNQNFIEERGHFNQSCNQLAFINLKKIINGEIDKHISLINASLPRFQAQQDQIQDETQILRELHRPRTAEEEQKFIKDLIPKIVVHQGEWGYALQRQHKQTVNCIEEMKKLTQIFRSSMNALTSINETLRQSSQSLGYNQANGMSQYQAEPQNPVKIQDAKIVGYLDPSIQGLSINLKQTDLSKDTWSQFCTDLTKFYDLKSALIDFYGLMIEPGHICQLVLSLAENKFVNDLILNFVRTDVNAESLRVIGELINKGQQIVGIGSLGLILTNTTLHIDEVNDFIDSVQLNQLSMLRIRHNQFTEDRVNDIMTRHRANRNILDLRK